jgi:hypothetical protein
MDAYAAPPNPFASDSVLALQSLQQAFFLPGDWAIYVVARHVPAAAEALGLSPALYGSAVSASLSLVGWSSIVIALLVALGAVRDFDRFVTGKIGALYSEACRRVRMALVLARYRRARQRPQPEPVVTVTEDLDLSRDELRVLQLHATVAPGYALAVSEVATQLRARGFQLHAPLERLTRLALLETTLGGLDDETAYTLTPAGRALLRTRSRR